MLLFLFICFWLCWVMVAAQTVLQLGCAGFSLRGFSSCRGQVLGCTGSVAVAHCMGLVAPRHVESLQTWNQSPVSCMGKQILYHQEKPLNVF